MSGTWTPGSGATSGNDTFIATVAGGVNVDGLGGNDYLSGNIGNDTLLGNDGNDSIFGSSGNDSLLGGAGTDTLDGGSGNDTLAGGVGNDSLIGGTGNDWVDYSASAAAVNVVLNTNGNTGGDAQGDSMLGGAFEGLIGSDHNDTLAGDGSANSILGGGGNDQILAGGGNDYVEGGTGFDIISGDTGSDTILGGLSNDSILGGDGNDQLIGDQANDSTTGGNDTIDGGIGNDSIFGNFGNDTLSGGLGDDRLVGDSGDDSIVGGLGADLVQGGAGNDTVVGGDFGTGKDGSNTVWGGLGDDSIHGGNDVDVFYVGLNEGDDTITDGGGSDTLYLAGYTGQDGLPSLPTGTYGQWNFTSLKAGGGVFTRANTISGGVDSVWVDNSVNYILNGDSISLPPDTDPCFATGTLIATARGEVAVEDLRVGDLVVTAQGGAALQPIVWIGHSRANVARHPDPRRIAPVLIKAGALGEGVPHRDLRVSPDHGMFVDGYLVPAGRLVNGTTIVQELWCPEVTYWHVELPAHGLVVSEGAVSESYLDDGNRKQFDNYGITTLFKDFASERANGRYGAQACRPVLEEGSEVLDRIRARLAARAEASAKAGARRTA